MEVRVGDNLPDDSTVTDDEEDLDGDGFSRVQGDCDDLDADRGPGNEIRFEESCDGVDNDCSGVADEDTDGALICAREAEFVQRLSVDVLFVVDRSPRNDVVRQRAADAAGDFLGAVFGPGLDTHVAVVTMDLDDEDHLGRLVLPIGAERPYVGPGDSVAAAANFVARAIADSGTQFDGEEGGRAAVVRTMHESNVNANRGFYRPGNPLALVFLSAEDDGSLTPTIPDFLDTLDQSGPYRVHAVVQTSPFGCDGNESGLEGTSYLDLALLTNGLSQTVCADDYGPFFSALGQYTAIQGLSSRFPLPEPAQSESLEVDITLPGAGFERTLEPGEIALTDGGRTVVLLSDPPPPAGSEIRVRYLRRY